MAPRPGSPRPEHGSRLAGTVTLVTGATGGIGRAVVEQVAALGGVVVATARDDASLAAMRRRLGCTVVPADLRDPATADRLVALAVQEHGRLDAVVANAGVGHAGPLAQMPAQRIAELVDVNLRAPMLLAAAALPALRAARRGRLVLVTSIAGAVGVPGETVYSATKAGLAMFADVLREELHGSGVTVSEVMPGVVDTGFFERRGAAYDRRRPRPLSPERVASRIVDALESGRARQVEPPWLEVPARLAGAFPATYRALARRFG